MRKPPVAYPIPLRLLLRLGLARFPEKAESSRGHCCVEALGDGYLNRCGTGVKASSYFFSFPLFLLLLLYFPFLPSGGGEGRPTLPKHILHSTHKVQGGRDFGFVLKHAAFAFAYCINTFSFYFHY